MLTAVVEAYGSAAEPSPPSEPRDPEHRPGDADVLPRRRSEQHGKPLAEVLLIAVLVLGLGGLAVTEAVRHGVESITGNAPGTEGPEQLRGPVTKSVGGLSLTVESVKRSGDFTSVRLAVRNGTGAPVTMPIERCSFRGADGSTREAFPFQGGWAEDVAPGGPQRGTVIFVGHLPNSVRQASLSFTTIYSDSFSGPDSITVPNIMLK
jgi:hypothetical protein